MHRSVFRGAGRGVGLAMALVALGMVFGVVAEAAAAEVVNVYSYRKKVLIQPLMDRFTEKTGVKVRLVSGKADALLERLKSEGMNSPADVLLTADAGRLIRAKKAGVLRPATSAALDKLVPAKFRDPEGYWYGFSMRARVVVHAADRVAAGDLATYEDLVDPRWRDRICIRSSGNVYNQSLLASLIAHNGTEAAEAWAKGVVANMARKPQGGDRDQIKAVAAGECDIAVVNTYYLAKMLTAKGAQKEAAAKVKLLWPNQGDRGVHVNISGGAVTRSAKNDANALRLLEFLASDEAQAIYAGDVHEYPVRAGLDTSSVVASWGAFKADGLDLAKLGEHQEQAMRIFDRAGWR